MTGQLKYVPQLLRKNTKLQSSITYWQRSQSVLLSFLKRFPLVFTFINWHKQSIEMQHVWMWFSSTNLLFLDTWSDYKLRKSQVLNWDFNVARQFLIGENCNAHVLARLVDDFCRWEIHCSSEPSQKVFQVARILESIMCLPNMANSCLLTLITIHLCLPPQRMVLLQKGLKLTALATLPLLRE